MAGSGKLSGAGGDAGEVAAEGLAVMVRAMETDDFWVMAAILVALTLAGFWWAFRSLRRARMIEDTPTSRIRSAAQGFVELVGRQLRMDGEPITAPLTRSDCTWWSYTVERKERSGKNTYWRTIHQGISEACFLIEDETGRCVVDPDDAEVFPSASQTWYGSSDWPTAGPGNRSLFSLGRYRYNEKRMHHGDELYAIGMFHTKGDHLVHDMDQALTERLREWKQDRAQLLARFDHDGDGEVDGEEWEAARKAAKHELHDEYAERLAAGGIDVMAAPTDGRPYILSVVPQTGLARRYRWQAGAAIVLFFLAGAASVFTLTARLI